MKLQSLLLKIVATTLGMMLLTGGLSAQSADSSPKEERLLNGLKFLMFNDPAAAKVSMVVRVHAGSAFDPQGKEGVMKLLASNIFPNPEIKEYFADELGGSLDIEDNYDFIEVKATAAPDKLLTMMEAVSTAVANVPVEKETTDKLKAAQLKRIEDLLKNPAYVADQAAAARLLGSFPYGRPIEGTPESIGKIEFADMLLAKQRFFTADNATVAISGKFDSDLAYRAARRFLGSWLKSDKLVPATFRRPDDPPAAMLTLNSPDPDKFAVRFVARGTSRASSDMAAYAIAARIVESRLKSAMPGRNDGEIVVRSNAYMLPGTFVIAFNGAKESVASKFEATDVLGRILSQPVTDGEFQSAKQSLLADAAKEPLADRWLDADTYKTDRPAKVQSEIDAVNPGNVQDVLARLQKQPFATVVVSSPKTAS